MNLVTYNPTPQELAEALSPQEFELLLRAYIRPRMAKLTPADASLWLFCHCDYGKSELKTATWTVGLTSELQTKGEILDHCVDEQNRRRDFAQSNKLLLLEAAAEPVIEAEPVAEPVAAATVDGDPSF